MSCTVPQHIYCTAERLDIVVWLEESKEVILVELTVGDESNFSDQVARKEARYNRELIPGLLGKRRMESSALYGRNWAWRLYRKRQLQLPSNVPMLSS